MNLEEPDTPADAAGVARGMSTSTSFNDEVFSTTRACCNQGFSAPLASASRNHLCTSVAWGARECSFKKDCARRTI